MWGGGGSGQWSAASPPEGRPSASHHSARDGRTRIRLGPRRAREGHREDRPRPAQPGSAEGRDQRHLARPRPAPDAHRRGDRVVHERHGARPVRWRRRRQGRQPPDLRRHRRLPADRPHRRERLGGQRAGRPAVRRVGLVHASSNALALTLYASSLAARKRGDHGKGKLLGFAGAAVLGLGGYLGGHMSFVQGVGPNQTVFDEGPDDWTEAAKSSDLGTASRRPWSWTTRPCCCSATATGCTRCTTAARTAAARWPSWASWTARRSSAAATARASASATGPLERGPATVGQPAYEVREQDGTVEIKLHRCPRCG